METVKLYYTNPYMKETGATVTAVTDKGFYLDKTIFYPECGGQRGDSGYFGSIRITTTEKDSEGNPLHITEGPLPKVGDKATLRLDWDERYFGMVEHTAQHLISSVLWNSFGIGTVAVHHGKDEITIETDRSNIPESTLIAVEDECIHHIGENRKVWMEEMERAEAEKISRRSVKVDDAVVKVVFIDGIDAVACGGVHLAALGEIGELVYTGSDAIRGHARTIWRVGVKAKEARRENAQILSEAKTLLSSDSSSFLSDLERLITEKRDLEHRNRELMKTIAVSEFKAHEGKVVVYSTDAELDSLVDAACADRERKVFITGPGNTFMFVGTKDEFSSLREKLSLKGGGREPLFRGKAEGNRDEVLSAAENLLSSFQN